MQFILRKADDLARKYLCYVRPWYLKQWLSFSSTTDSQSQSLLIEHQDIIDQAIYELHPRLISVLPIDESLFKHFNDNDVHDRTGLIWQISQLPVER